MKIGIIVYSQTGNTASVAQRVSEELIAAGHQVQTERVTTAGELKPGQPVTLENTPDTNKYDALVFAAPVQGFSLAAAMSQYLNGLGDLGDKKAALFTTQHFKRPWLGGNRTIRQMRDICIAKGAIPCETAVINWSNPERERQIEECAQRLAKAF